MNVCVSTAASRFFPSMPTNEPLVAGRKLANDLLYFEKRCLTLIEQCGYRPPRPIDVIEVTSDAVRLARECQDTAIGAIASSPWQPAETMPVGTVGLICAMGWQNPIVAFRTDRGDWSSYPGKYQYRFVEFWMPLPELPK